MKGPIQAVIFDLGYTLINFDGDFGRVINESYLVLARSLRHAGYAINEVEFATRFNDLLSEYYRTREEDLIEKPVEQFLSRVLALYEITNPPGIVIQNSLEQMYRFTESYWHLEADALSTLQQLREAGFRLGMITNAANEANVNRLIDRFALRPYFEVILISAVEKIRKPDSRIYARLINQMGVPAGAMVMVGDTLTADILGAQNAGLQAVWINRRADRAENRAVLQAITPDAVITSLSELPAVLQSIE